jgi:hypothetical protein
MDEPFLEEESHWNVEGRPHSNVSGSKFTTPEGVEKFAMDVKLADTTDDNSDIDSNIRDIKLLLRQIMCAQLDFQRAIITHLEIINNEEKL